MATHRYSVAIHQTVSTSYVSDLNDQEFELIAPPAARQPWRRGCIWWGRSTISVVHMPVSG